MNWDLGLLLNSHTEGIQWTMLTDATGPRLLAEIRDLKTADRAKPEFGPRGTCAGVARLRDAKVSTWPPKLRGRIMNSSVGLTLASAFLLVAGFGATSANAFIPKPAGLDAATAIATPAAMCGRSCRNGGRYIPGPPSVCADEGLNYCGSSRDAVAVGVPAWSFPAPVSASVLARAVPASMSRRAAIAAQSPSSGATAA